MTDRQGLPEGGYVVVPRWVAQIVIAMAITTLSGIFYVGWYMSSLDSRVATLEVDASRMKTASDRQIVDRDRLTVVEQQIISIRQAQEAQTRILERMESRIEGIYRNGPPLPARRED